jgi:hypothetical protein
MREEIRRYGEWILVQPYGKLWHPNATQVGENFVPYVSGGQWVLTQRGWSFEGRWEWSDVVFHHGRWLWNQDYDWLWQYDENEALAHVEWRSGSEWIGWSPLPAVAQRSGSPEPERRWYYVKAKHLAQEDVARFVVTGEEAGKAAGLTEPVTAGPFFGPAVAFVAQQGGLVQQADGGYRVPELEAPAREAPVVQEAPRSNVEVDVPKPPPEKPSKKKKKKR